MGYLAQWGPKGFLISPEKIVPFEEFKATMSVKSDSQDDASGTSKTNLKGTEPEVVSFSTQYLISMGVDPWAQVEEWRTLQGKAHPLYIGGKTFAGGVKFMLKSAEVSNTLFSNAGDFLGLKMSFTFEGTGSTAAATSSSKKTSNGKKGTVKEATEAKPTADFIKDKAVTTVRKVTDVATDIVGSVTGKSDTDTTKVPEVKGHGVSTITYRGKQYEVIEYKELSGGLWTKRKYPVIMYNGKKTVVTAD